MIKFSLKLSALGLSFSVRIAQRSSDGLQIVFESVGENVAFPFRAASSLASDFRAAPAAVAPVARNDYAKCESDSGDREAFNLQAFSLPASRFTPEEVHLEQELSETEGLMAEC